jgi:small subunit ribosomal protein S14
MFLVNFAGFQLFHPLYSCSFYFLVFPMARKAVVVKQQRRQKEHLRALRDGRRPKFPTKVYNRCSLCARKGGYMGFFGICRICFRELAANGEIAGVTKSSW